MKTDFNLIFTYHACEAEYAVNLPKDSLASKEHFAMIPINVLMRQALVIHPQEQLLTSIDIKWATEVMRSEYLAWIFKNTFPWRN